MSTLATMKTRIASEIARADLTTQIASAITDAITVYQHERFRFSDTLPNTMPTFATVAGRSVYTSADNAAISAAHKISNVYVLIGDTQQELGRSTPSTVFTYNQAGTMTGQPSWFAFEGDQLVLSPVPAAVYTITMDLFRNVAAPASDSEASNPWMIEAERLIRARAKYELAVHVTRNPTMAAAMSPDPPAGGQPMGAAWREYKLLKGAANRVTSRGVVAPMRF